MTFEISEYSNVSARAAELGLRLPSEIAILPSNFDSAKSKAALTHRDTVSTIRKLWRDAGVEEVLIDADGERIPYLSEKSFGWVGPIIFVGSALLANNTHLLSIALGVISNYLTDWFKGIPNARQVTLDIVVEQTPNKSYKRIRYRGTPEGIRDLPAVVREAAQVEPKVG